MWLLLFTTALLMLGSLCHATISVLRYREFDTAWGKMKFSSPTTASYDYKGGAVGGGKIEKKGDVYVMTGYWSELGEAKCKIPGGPPNQQRMLWGRVRFEFKATKNSLFLQMSGKWSYCDKDPMSMEGQNWTGSLIKKHRGLGGLRFKSNFGIVHFFFPEDIARYDFNTGTIAPTMGRGKLGKFDPYTLVLDSYWSEQQGPPTCEERGGPYFIKMRRWGRIRLQFFLYNGEISNFVGHYANCDKEPSNSDKKWTGTRIYD